MEKENLDFSQDVLERSNDVPVLVDFWSPTCGPCLYLGPILEKLEKESEGKWELVKVNTMFNQDLAYQYQISSIPAVKLFHKGQIINEFVGALPEKTLRQWLEEFIPDERKEELNAIVERLATDNVLASAQLETFVDENPDILLAKFYLAREVLFENPKKANAMLDDIKLGHLLYDSAEGLRILAELIGFEGDDSNVDQKIGESREALKIKDFEAAIDAIIEATVIDKRAHNELPRRGSIALFQLFGRNHPLTAKYRKKFEMALY